MTIMQLAYSTNAFTRTDLETALRTICDNADKAIPR